MGADLVKVMATGAMLSSEHEDARAIQNRLEELRGRRDRHDNHKHVAAHAHACRGIENAVEPAATASSTAASPTRPC